MSRDIGFFLNSAARELTLVMQAARPLAPQDRSEFLREVALRLECYPTLGEGVVGRTVREVQGRYFDPPHCSRRPHEGKYR